MGRSEITCARCGTPTPHERLRLWQQDEHHRVFQGPGRTRPTADVAGAPASTAIYARVRKRCAYLTCERCHDHLQKGGGLDDLHNRKIAIYTAAVLVLGIGIAVITPIAMPGLLIAFWHW
jgi:hypothetical protein